MCRASALIRTGRSSLALACVCGLLAATAHGAADEAGQTRAAIDGLVQAAGALERGDRDAALQSLDAMAASVATLRDSAEGYRGRAQTMEQTCQNRSIAVVDEIANTHALQRQKETDLANLQPRFASLDAQLRQVGERKDALDQREREILDDLNFLEDCNRRGFWYYAFTGRCIKLGWRQEFQGGFWLDTTERADINNQLTQLSAQRSELTGEQGRLRGEEADARSRITQLEADRRRLEILDRATRAAATTLSDIALFWSQAEIVIRQRLAGDIAMLRTLLPALDKTGPAPAFDDYEKQDIRSLRDTMFDFSRSLDAGRNFLASDLAC